MGLVIGLHGAKGSGKDQFYKAATAAFPHLDIRKIAYADPIKNEVCRIFDLADESQYDLFKRTNVQYTLPGYLSHNVHGRQVVREIGMLMRRYDEGQFVRYVEDEISKAPQAIWCITDVRFDNELQSIKNRLNGILIKIKRSGVNFDGHATETEFADELCTSVLYNTDLTLLQYNDLVINHMNSILHTLAIQKENR